MGPVPIWPNITIIINYCRTDTLNTDRLNFICFIKPEFLQGIPLAKLVLIVLPKLPLGNLGDLPSYIEVLVVSKVKRSSVSNK